MSPKLVKFIEYLSGAFNYNMTEAFDEWYLQPMITKWKEAKDLRELKYELEVIGPFTWYANSLLADFVNQANYEYSERNYSLAVNKYNDAKELMASSFWLSLDFIIWIAIAGGIILASLVFIRRQSKKRKEETLFGFRD